MPVIRRMLIIFVPLVQLTLAATAQVDRQLSNAQAQPTAAPLVLTFQDAVTRAQKNMPQFLAAKTDYGLAHEDKVQARAALLPSVTYNTQFLYTQPNGTPTGVFIANNTIHEYASQGNAHEVINLAGFAAHPSRRSGGTRPDGSGSAWLGRHCRSELLWPRRRPAKVRYRPDRVRRSRAVP